MGLADKLRTAIETGSRTVDLLAREHDARLRLRLAINRALALMKCGRVDDASDVLINAREDDRDKDDATV